jgi:hypothetical protein
LMNNTHEDAPEIFQSRWALSYLRGPLTKDQIKILMDPLKALSSPAGVTMSPTQKPTPVAPIPGGSSSTQPPSLPPGIQSFYIPVRGSATQGNKLLYQPKVLGAAKINFSDPKTRVDSTVSKVFITPVTDNAIPVVWDTSEEIGIPATDLEKSPQTNANFADLASAASQNKNYSIWTRDFNNWLYGTQKVDLLQSPGLKEISRPGENEGEFRVRLQQLAREQRDLLVEGLRKKYGPKNVVLQERLRRAQQAVEKQAEQAKQAKLQTAISLGSTLLGAFTGRRISSSTISRASTTMRGFGRAIDEGKDVDRAGDTVESIQQQIKALQDEFNNEVAALDVKIDPTTETLAPISIKPNKADILVQLVSLVWVPYWQDAQGNSTPAW